MRVLRTLILYPKNQRYVRYIVAVVTEEAWEVVSWRLWRQSTSAAIVNYM